MAVSQNGCSETVRSQNDRFPQWSFPKMAVLKMDVPEMAISQNGQFPEWQFPQNVHSQNGRFTQWPFPKTALHVQKMFKKYDYGSAILG